jgi:1-deoxy-D-xylulose-5-phosphate synthase
MTTSSSDTDYPVLDKINLPDDLRSLPLGDMPQASDDLRRYLIESVSQCGGHFAAGLGVIELTVALHYVYNTPQDKLVWDVGHQSYPHKILTGRKDQITSIRQKNGLGPFPSPSESEYDSLTVGHSSTSIGAALGMNISFQNSNSDQQAVAIIGDGGLSAGMAYEALNHLGALRTNMLIILNDNEMSISPNVGAMSNYLTRMLSGRVLTSVREGSKRLLKPLPPMWELAKKTEEHVKGMFAPGTLFEEMGIRYFGPVDGHDSVSLIKTLRNIKQINGPKILHVITKKGKGYELAERDPVKYHAVGQFDPEVGINKSAPSKPTYTNIFSDWICDSARKDERVMAITPAMREGSGLIEFEKAFPERYFDVAIAEQHAVTLAAGMALAGDRPVVAIYSTFLQRAYDQLIHDVAIENLPVLFAIDRAGVVGPDGKTHAGSYDLTYLRCIPNMIVMTPSDENATRQMLNTGLAYNGPSAVRYPRGVGPGVPVETKDQVYDLGKAEIKREGKDIALLAFGSPTQNALLVGEQLNATVVDMRFVKPIDTNLIETISKNHALIVTLEDNVIMGGAGSAVNEVLAECGSQVRVLNLGLPDRHQEHGSREELLQDAGLDKDSILAKIKEIYPLRDCATKSAVVVSSI